MEDVPDIFETNAAIASFLGVNAGTFTRYTQRPDFPLDRFEPPWTREEFNVIKKWKKATLKGNMNAQPGDDGPGAGGDDDPPINKARYLALMIRVAKDKQAMKAMEGQIIPREVLDGALFQYAEQASKAVRVAENELVRRHADLVESISAVFNELRDQMRSIQEININLLERRAEAAKRQALKRAARGMK